MCMVSLLLYEENSYSMNMGCSKILYYKKCYYVKVIDLQTVADDVQRHGKLKELADELEMVPKLVSLRHDENPPLTLLHQWHSEIESGLEARSLLVHHLKCIRLPTSVRYHLISICVIR